MLPQKKIKNYAVEVGRWVVFLFLLAMGWAVVRNFLGNDADVIRTTGLSIVLSFVLTLIFMLLGAFLFPRHADTIADWAADIGDKHKYILLAPILLPFLILWVVTYPFRAYKKRQDYKIITPWMEKNKHKLLETEKEYIAITPQPTDEQIPLTQSKFGGYPYLPKDMQFPIDKKRKPFYLIAQLNFADIPHLPDFPTKGILQFYIYDESNFDPSDEEAKLLYFPEVLTDSSKIQTDFSWLKYKNMNGFIEKNCKLTFEKKKGLVSYGDYYFRKIVGSKFPKIEQNDAYALHEKFGIDLTAEGHKVGGYPHFNQRDPRKSKKYRNEDWILLLQIDTGADSTMDWSGGGVLSFFIKKEDLRNLDFSNVIFYEDKP